MQSMMMLFNVLWHILLNVWDDAGRRLFVLNFGIDIHLFLVKLEWIGWGWGGI